MGFYTNVGSHYFIISIKKTLKNIQSATWKIILSFLLISGLLYMTSCSKENKDNAPQSNKTENSNTEKSKTEDPNKDVKTSDNFIVSYDLVGKLNGKMQILRSGNKFKQIINSEMMGMQSKSNVYIIDNIVYSVTEIAGKKLGTKATLSEYNSQKHTGETIIDFKEFERFLNTKKVAGSENILGYNCEVYDIGDGYFLTVYDKKYITKIKSGEFMATATNIEIDPNLAANEFVVPADVDFKNVNPNDVKKEALDSMIDKMKK